MGEIRKREVILDLARDAIEALCHLGDHFELELLPFFETTQQALKTETNTGQHQLLVITAARQRIVEAEKKTIAFILHDDSVTERENSYLARLRLICYRMKNLLNDAIYQMKMDQPALNRKVMR